MYLLKTNANIDIHSFKSYIREKNEPEREGGGARLGDRGEI